MPTDFGINTILEAEVHQIGLRCLHQGMERYKACLYHLFPTPPPREMRRYTIPANFHQNGRTFRLLTSMVVRSPSVPLDYNLDFLETKHLPFAMVNIDDAEVTVQSDQSVPSSAEGTSILDSMVHFRDLPDLEFGVPDLLHWLSTDLSKFTQLEYTQPLIEVESLELFAEWVERILNKTYQELSKDGSSVSSRTSSNSSRCSSITLVEEADANDANSVRSSSSGHSSIAIPADYFDLRDQDHALLSTLSTGEIDAAVENYGRLDLEHVFFNSEG